MKKHFFWMMAAIMICGSAVFSACSNDDDSSSSTEESKGGVARQTFISHARADLKDLAENLNFSSWNLANDINSYFNQYVLNNSEFKQAIASAFMLQASQTIKPVEEGSELAEMGYQMYGIVDFTAFNYRFTMNDEGNGFDVEPADDFEMIISAYDPLTERIVPRCLKLTLKAGGSSFLVNMKKLGSDKFAVVGKMPTEFAFAISTNLSGDWYEVFNGTFKNDVRMDGTSQYVKKMDAFNISGIVNSALRSIDADHKDDATTATFAIGQDPVTHEAGVQFGFIHNGKEIIQLRGVMENLNGMTDYSQHTSASSIAEAFAIVMAGNNLKEGTITLLGDLTTTVKVNKCDEVVRLQNQMASARRNYADEATIDSYTQQLNKLITCSMTCKGVDQTIPMKLQTTQLGIDYWASPALKFPDESDYVTLTDMLDKESILYMVNIADHGVEPMKQSIHVVRQLMQYAQNLMGGIEEKKQAK